MDSNLDVDMPFIPIETRSLSRLEMSESFCTVLANRGSPFVLRDIYFYLVLIALDRIVNIKTKGPANRRAFYCPFFASKH